MNNLYDRISTAINDFRAGRITLEQYSAVVAGTAPAQEEVISHKPIEQIVNVVTASIETPAPPIVQQPINPPTTAIVKVVEQAVPVELPMQEVTSTGANEHKNHKHMTFFKAWDHMKAGKVIYNDKRLLIGYRLNNVIEWQVNGEWVVCPITVSEAVATDWYVEK